MKFFLICLLLLLCAVSVKAEDFYSPPITITHGGDYTGNWESQDVNTPAVTVATTQPVIIHDCYLKGPWHLISSIISGSDITVKNCVGTNTASQNPGRFLKVYRPFRMIVEHNSLFHTGGIYANGDTFPSVGGISVRFNKVLNVEGRTGNPLEGYSNTDFVLYHFLQLDKVEKTPNIEISWNQIINKPYQSRVEDNINIYQSSGTVDSPIQIHDNYVQGAYPSDPLNQLYSGGGIITDGPTSSLTLATGYVNIYDNQVIGTTNYGIAIAAGHDVLVTKNRIISSGRIYTNQVTKAANVGSYVIGQSADISAGTFFNNSVTNNYIAWMNTSKLNNIYFPSCTGTNCTGNTLGTIAVSLYDESLEWNIWQTKVLQNNITIGSSLTGVVCLAGSNIPALFFVTNN